MKQDNRQILEEWKEIKDKFVKKSVDIYEINKKLKVKDEIPSAAILKTFGTLDFTK